MAAATGEDLFLLAALGIPVSLIVIFVIYLISTGRWDDVKRIGPLLSVPGIVTGAAVVFRTYYKSDWGQYLSNAMILIAYAIGLYLIIREFNLARRPSRFSRAGLGADD